MESKATSKKHFTTINITSTISLQYARSTSNGGQKGIEILRIQAPNKTASLKYYTFLRSNPFISHPKDQENPNEANSR